MTGSPARPVSVTSLVTPAVTALIGASDTPAWTGQWVARELGVVLRTTDSPIHADVSDLVGLAVRRNPRRAHLIVSRVLGKHVPADPRLVQGAGLLLGGMVRALLSEDSTMPGEELSAQLVLATGTGRAARQAAATLPAAVLAAQPDRDAAGDYPAAVVLGYAETATGLGQCVADALHTAVGLHSTRRPVQGVDPVPGFEEEHSHATSHLLLPRDPTMLMNALPLVLVDDELSTGTTVLNTIAALHQGAPRHRYVVAALVDVRSQDDRDRMDEVSALLGARIDVVSLVAGRVDLPDDVLVRGQDLVASVAALERHGRPAETAPGNRGIQGCVDVRWPREVPVTGRHGFTPSQRHLLDDALPGMARTLAAAVRAQGLVRRVLVLGCEELMYAPLRLACALADALDADAGQHGVQVQYSTTTRSPVLAVDDPAYAIRTRLTFPAHDRPADGPGQRYVYNVAAGSHDEERFDTVVLVLDTAAETAELRADGGLLDLLTAETDRVLLVVLPESAGPVEVVSTGGMTPALPEPLRGPLFGSYVGTEVAWLLKDLSGVVLEAPTEEREEAIQSGGAHYAQSLPVEYQPTAEYQQLFSDALAANANRVAHAVGVVTEMVLAARGPGAVLVSLARAGTPVGILMRRWAQFAHGVDVAHYAVSIIRGRGIDTLALKYLAAHHDPTSVMFVDGWTGKGAIARELAAAVAMHNDINGEAFSPDLAVLADPGRCVELFGTREDYLVPSACLNSTVSGLVSRTVLNDELIGPSDFHGAKFYAELHGADRSGVFLDAVSARFADVAEAVTADWPIRMAADRRATWEGWAAVERISQEYGIGDANLVKPGVGETTRVLLRRVPWKVLVRADAHAELAHIRMLAEQRGVPVHEEPDLPYSCVGLIHPRYTRGATNATGTSAAPQRRTLA